MSAVDELGASAFKDKAYSAADNAGGDAPCAVDEQCLEGAPAAPRSAPPALPATDVAKREDEGKRSSSYSSRPGYGTPVVYVRVPVGTDYQGAQYPRNEPPGRGGWGGGRGGGRWDDDGGWDGGGGRNAFSLRDGGDWDVVSAFSEAAVRRAFVRKVYATLSLQLAFTLGFIAICIFEPNVKRFLQSQWLIYWLAFGVFFVTYVVLVCCEGARRQFPTNVILLSIFTLSMAYMLGMVAVYYTPYIVFMALAMTVIITLLVSLVATFTKLDITGCGALLCVLGMGVFVFGMVVIIVFLITHNINMLVFAVYGGLVCILFSLYLMYDTQLMMGGRQLQLSPDEYIFAALSLYMDIAYIFWGLLMCLGGCANE